MFLPKPVLRKNFINLPVDIFSKNIFDIIDSWAYDASEAYGWHTVVHDDKIDYMLAIPGYKKEELDVEISGRFLIVKTAEGATPKFGNFRTEIALHKEADLDKYEAKIEDGVLYLTFAKRQDQLPIKQKILL